MMRMMNRFGFLLAVLLAPAAAMAQEARVVVVNTDQAVLKSTVGSQADATLTKKFDEKKKEFEATKKQIDGLKEELTIKGSVLNEKARTDLQRKIADLEKNLAYAIEDGERELDTMRRELLEPIVKVARSELDKLVAEKNYEIVLDVGGDGPAIVIHWDKKIEITDELIKRINANSTLKTSGTDAKPADPKAAAAEVKAPAAPPEAKPPSK